MLKAAVAGLVLSVSGFANAGLIEYTYDGPIGNDVDTNPASLFEITITDNYIISDLNVQFELFDSSDLFWTDLDLTISNGFTTVILASAQNILFGSDGLFNVTFDDEALNNLSTGNSVGSYKSLESLSAFDGQNITGTWTLSIFDDYQPGENNNLISYSITATTTSVPEPSTLAIFALGIMGLASRRFKKQ